MAESPESKETWVKLFKPWHLVSLCFPEMYLFRMMSRRPYDRQPSPTVLENAVDYTENPASREETAVTAVLVQEYGVVCLRQGVSLRLLHSTGHQHVLPKHKVSNKKYAQSFQTSKSTESSAECIGAYQCSWECTRITSSSVSLRPLTSSMTSLLSRNPLSWINLIT